VTNYEQFYDKMLIGLYRVEKREPGRRMTLGHVARTEQSQLLTYAAVQFAEDCRENLFAEVEHTSYRANTWKARILPAGISHVEAELLPRLAIDSGKWTGLPSQLELTQERLQRLISELARVEREIGDLPLSNSEKAQIRSMVLAAKILAESPDPPADLIWELIERANSLAGLASLFVALLALFRS